MSVSSQKKSDIPAGETKIIVKNLRVRQTYKRTLTGSISKVSFWDPRTDRNYQPMPSMHPSVRGVLRALRSDCVVQARIKLGVEGGKDSIVQITDARPLPRKSIDVFFETVLPDRDTKWQSKGGHAQASTSRIRDPNTNKMIARKWANLTIEKEFWASGNRPLRVISKRSLLGIVTILGIVGAEADLPVRMAI